MNERHIVLLVALLAACGCDDAEEDGLRVGTYNAGLAPGFVPLVEERAPLTVNAIADQALDVACVQEVWEQANMDALVAATRTRWSNTLIPAPQPATAPGTAPACSATDLGALGSCITSTCSGVASEDVAGCALAQCNTELFDLPDACSTCLAANIGGSFEDIQRTCTTEPGPRFAFNGSFGLALLSRLPLLDTDVLVLDSTLNRRAVLYARVEAPEVTAHVFCTHLTPIFDDIPFPGTGGWEGEQRAQIEALIDFVDSKTTPEDRIVLLGDLNTGPGFGGITAVAQENYNLVLTRFPTDVYLEAMETPLCTFCGDNPLVPEGTPSSIIDHILVRNLDAQNVERILDGTVDVPVDGRTETVTFSDHFGVRAALIE